MDSLFDIKKRKLKEDTVPSFPKNKSELGKLWLFLLIPLRDWKFWVINTGAGCHVHKQLFQNLFICIPRTFSYSIKLKSFVTSCNAAPHIRGMMPPTMWHWLCFSGLVTGEGSEGPSASRKGSLNTDSHEDRSAIWMLRKVRWKSVSSKRSKRSAMAPSVLWIGSPHTSS